ncbi:MAG: ribonuclease HII [Alphaproteobacteria bacterium]|nr:ribonuclease HII [Alphaproteobacteria bacterium]
MILGIDEVGRGPLAGPVVACACLVDDAADTVEGVGDSKKLSKSKIYSLDKILTAKYKYGIGSASVSEIDELNILEATKLAMYRAEEGVNHNARRILVDGNMKFTDTRFESVIKGDSLVYAISCASIIAKAFRDRLMIELSKEYSDYEWHKNAGYGTKNHIAAIKKLGPTPLHRKKFISQIIG